MPVQSSVIRYVHNVKLFYVNVCLVPWSLSYKNQNDCCKGIQITIKFSGFLVKSVKVEILHFFLLIYIMSLFIFFSKLGDSRIKKGLPELSVKFWSLLQESTLSQFCESCLLYSPNFFFRFVGGELNICYNAVDRHVENGRGDHAAIIYDSPVTNTKEKITYKELLEQVRLRITLLLEIGWKYCTAGGY